MFNRLLALESMFYAPLVGVANATTFDYALNCPAVAVGPDTIWAVSKSGTVTLTPNQPLIPTDLHLLQLSMGPVGAVNPLGTFTSTVTCQFTFAGQTVPLTRSVTMTVNYLILGESTPRQFQEQHQYAFQALSTTASAGPAGTVTISESGLDFNILLQSFVTDFKEPLCCSHQHNQPLRPSHPLLF